MGSIIYYIRRGGAIKIGTTANPVTRFASLMPDEILAFEPGALAEEKARHQQFKHLRSWGEHFRPDPELLEHARELRRLHGDPDPDWPTVAILEKVPEAKPPKPKKKAGRPPKPPMVPGERWCSEHHRPRKTCPPSIRHVRTMRCDDELFAQVDAAAAALGLDRNAVIEMALREFVQARERDAAQVA